STSLTPVSEKFLERIYNPKQFYAKPTKFGKANENTAIQQYEKRTGNHIHQCGFVVNPKLTFLGATPDGIVCDKGVTGLIEVKCPISARNLTPFEASGSNKCFLTLSPTSGELTLNHEHSYYFQVQGQLLITDMPYCDF